MTAAQAAASAPVLAAEDARVQVRGATSMLQHIAKQGTTHAVTAGGRHPVFRQHIKYTDFVLPSTTHSLVQIHHPNRKHNYADDYHYHYHHYSNTHCTAHHAPPANNISTRPSVVFHDTDDVTEYVRPSLQSNFCHR